MPDDIWGSQRLGTRLVDVFEHCCVASLGFHSLLVAIQRPNIAWVKNI